MKKYHSVASGREPGIYLNETIALNQVNDLSYALHDGYDTLDEAISFMLTNGEHTEDNIAVFGPRGGRYTLRDWMRKSDTTGDMDNTNAKQLTVTDTSQTTIWYQSQETNKHMSN